MELGPKQKIWLQALRSGNYGQTKGRLKWSNVQTGELGFCCLGVANDCLGLGETNRGTLADTFMDLGLRSSTGEFAGSEYQFLDEIRCSCLVDFNDAGASFEWIADWIEANSEKVFTQAV